MLIYFIQLLLIFLCGTILLTNLKHKKILFILLYFFVIFIVMAFRDVSVGTDTKMYTNIFQSLATKKFESDFFGLKNMYIYSLYNIFVSFFSTSPQAIIISNSFIICLLLCILIYRNCNNHLFLSSILFILMTNYFESFNIVRQYMAVLLFLISLEFVKNKKIIPFLLLNICAFFIHATAICALIVIPIFFLKKYDKSWKYVLFILTVIIIAFSLSFFVTRFTDLFEEYEVYSINTSVNNYNNGRYLIVIFSYFAIIAACLFFSKLQNNFDVFKENYVFILVYVISIIFGIATYNFNVLSRFNLFFSTSAIIVIPILIDVFYDYRLKYSYAFLSVLVFSIQFYLVLSAGYNGVSVYNFY